MLASPLAEHGPPDSNDREREFFRYAYLLPCIQEHQWLTWLPFVASYLAPPACLMIDHHCQLVHLITPSKRRIKSTQHSSQDIASRLSAGISMSLIDIQACCWSASECHEWKDRPFVRHLCSRKRREENWSSQGLSIIRSIRLTVTIDQINIYSNCEWTFQ